MAESISSSLQRSAEHPQRFAEFYDATAQELLIFVTQRVLDPELAMEIAAETFARAYLARAQYRGGSDAEARGWLIRISQNEIAGYFRRASVERRGIERLGIQVPLLSPDDTERIEELADLEGARAEILAALSSLPQPQVAAIQLRIIAELPYTEVAARLGVSEQAARARVARGLRTLREGFTANPLQPEEEPSCQTS